MDVQRIKLDLIQKILNTDDPETLRVIDEILSNTAPQMQKTGMDLLNLLNNASPDAINDEDLQDLQQSIHDAFNVSD